MTDKQRDNYKDNVTAIGREMLETYHKRLEEKLSNRYPKSELTLSIMEALTEKPSLEQLVTTCKVLRYFEKQYASDKKLLFGLACSSLANAMELRFKELGDRNHVAVFNLAHP